MDAAGAAEAAEHLADLGQPAGTALVAMRRAADQSETSPQLVVAIDAVLAGHAGSALTPAAFAAIIEALNRARAAAVARVHPAIRPPKLHSGIEAVAGLVCFWAMTAAERSHVDPDTVTSSVALARILRNSLESLCLVEMLHEQERRRLQSAVDRIKADALSIVTTGGAHVG